MKKVAIYARVSTEHEAQLSALENQIQYFDEILSRNPDLELVDKYIDEGITGTSTKKRKNFMRMMEDAENGKFEMIITREVSRFARNTVDTLQETRKLKKLGIEVWFTEDNIKTMNDDDGELRLTIMATLAQNESKKTSMRVRAGQRVSFQNAVPYGSGNILGYDKLPNHGPYVINPVQAKTVRRIYELYLAGNGMRKIQDILEMEGHLTSSGLKNWNTPLISRVLKNPFYCGTIVYRKEYVADYLEQKKYKNRGEVEKVVVEGKHEPIVTKEEFEQVQRIMDTRVKAWNNGLYGVAFPTHVWSKKLICSCGHKLNRRTYSSGGDNVCYICYSVLQTGTIQTRINKGLPIEGVCNTSMVAQWKLEMMAHMIFSNFWKDKKGAIKIVNDILEHNIKYEIDENEDATRARALIGKITTAKNKSFAIQELRISNEIDPDFYIIRKKELDEEIEKYEKELAELNSKPILTEEDIEAKLRVLRFAIEQDFKFDLYKIPDSIIDAFVDKIVVYKDYFEWYLTFNDNSVKCLVEGTRKVNSKPTMINNLVCNADEETGCYRK